MIAWQLNESDASTYHVLFNVTFISMHSYIHVKNGCIYSSNTNMHWDWKRFWSRNRSIIVKFFKQTTMLLHLIINRTHDGCAINENFVTC